MRRGAVFTVLRRREVETEGEVDHRVARGTNYFAFNAPPPNSPHCSTVSMETIKSYEAIGLKMALHPPANATATPSATPTRRTFIEGKRKISALQLGGQPEE